MSFPYSLAPSSVDFISRDFDALASHMQQCETAHGRWPMARSHLQHARAIAAGRIVTLACVAVVIGIGFAVAA